MRELLFRGKRIDNDAWVEGFFVAKADPLLGIMASFILTQEFDTNGILCSHMDWYKVDPETVGQFTGLTDKNGKKIFEGDLCLCNRNINSFVDDQVFLISFDAEYGQWVGSSSSSNIVADEFSMCEVIGNIHDNPELLEEG